MRMRSPYLSSADRWSGTGGLDTASYCVGRFLGNPGRGSRGINTLYSCVNANINTIYFSGGRGCYGAIDGLRI